MTKKSEKAEKKQKIIKVYYWGKDGYVMGGDPKKIYTYIRAPVLKKKKKKKKVGLGWWCIN